MDVVRPCRSRSYPGNDRDRARRVMQERVVGQAQLQAQVPLPSTGPDDQQVRLRGGFQERLAWRPSTTR